MRLRTYLASNPFGRAYMLEFLSFIKCSDNFHAGFLVFSVLFLYMKLVPLNRLEAIKIGRFLRIQAQVWTEWQQKLLAKKSLHYYFWKLQYIYIFIFVSFLVIHYSAH